MPILIGAAWVAYQDIVSPFPTGKFWLALFAGICLHISANVFNDYFDWSSGTDQANNDYFLPYSGGSRSIELGLADEKTLLRVTSGALVIAGLIGLYLALASGLVMIAFGLVGAFLAYFYTAPPLRLTARKGLGELSVGLAFGPLATAGTVYALTGQSPLSSFLIGIPIGLLTVLIQWINQFPDEEADKATGQNNLGVVLGKENARWGYLLILLAGFGMVAYLVMTGHFPPLALITLLLIPFAVFACVIVFRNFAERSLIRANVATIQLHALAGLLMAASIFAAGVFFSG